MALETADLEKIVATVATMMGNMSTNGEKFSKVLEHAHKMGKKYNELSQDEIKLIEAKIKADDEYNDRIKRATDKIDQSGKKLASTLLDAVKGLGSMVNSVASSDQSFTALSPVVSMIGNVAKGVTEAMGKLLSGISVLGMSSGRFTEGVAQMVGVGIDLVTSAIQQQLEASQRMVNSFQNISKVGVTFGGSLDSLQHNAAKSGMSIDSFTKFIAKNVESLNQFGGSVTLGAQRVGHMSKSIIDGDKKLLAIYGSYDELASGVSDYMGMMSRYGADMNKSDKDLATGARDYLYNMKELSDLTGKSGDALKKEQEARANSLAYQMSLSKMSANERLNTEYALSMISAKYGKRAAEYAQEYVANGGKVFGEKSVQFASMMPAMAGGIQDILRDTNSNVQDFNKKTAQTMQEHNGAIKENVDSMGQLAKLQGAGVRDGGGILEMINDTGSAYYKSYNNLNNAVDAQAESEKTRNEKISASTKVYADSIQSLEKFKMQMDEMTIKHMPQMGQMMGVLYKAAEMSAKGLDHLDTALEKIVKAMNDAYDALEGRKPGSTNEGAQDDANWAKMNWSQKLESSMARGIEYAGKGLGKVPGLGFAGNLADSAKSNRIGAETQYLNSADGGAQQVKDAGLKVKPGDVTGGGASDMRTINAAKLIQHAFGDNFGVFTSFKDAYHKGFPGSDHNQGLAFDFTTNPAPKDAVEAGKVKSAIKNILSQAGIDPRYVGDEYFADKVAGTTGGHFHVSLPKMAKGGVTEGLSIAGEAGPEAVIPLPDGRSVPVKMDLAELLDKFDQMLDIMKDHKDVSEKHMKAAV